MQFEVWLAIIVSLQFVLNPKNTTTETVDEAKHFHSLSHDPIAIIIDPRKISRVSLAIQSSGV